jgi:hypothetical protein
MDDETVERVLKSVMKLIVSLETELLELKASVTVLKVTVASLTAENPEVALAQLREVEQKTLETLPASRKLQEVTDMMNLLEQHGKSLGKHKA